MLIRGPTNEAGIMVTSDCSGISPPLQSTYRSISGISMQDVGPDHGRSSMWLSGVAVPLACDDELLTRLYSINKVRQWKSRVARHFGVYRHDHRRAKPLQSSSGYLARWSSYRSPRRRKALGSWPTKIAPIWSASAACHESFSPMRLTARRWSSATLSACTRCIPCHE